VSGHTDPATHLDPVQESEVAYEHLSRKYKALFRYTKSCEEELYQILYRWLPRNVNKFHPLAQLRRVEEHGDMVDNYHLAEDIGKGNFGTVYRTNRPDGSVLAVKKMPKTKFLTLQSVGRLATELKLLCGVEKEQRHPNILYFNSVMHSATHLYISMPLLGKDVFELISEAAGEKCGLHETTALEIVTPVISALAHLNEMGFAHRDVKSENILVKYTTRRPREAPIEQSDYERPPMDVVVHSVQLIDFDMCCAVSEAQRSEGCGSLGFMAPEAMVKDVPDCTKLDTWSIGCVLLEVLFGHEWFSTNWLDHYRNHRELRYRGTADREGVDFFHGILSRETHKATRHVADLPRHILRSALVTNHAERASTSALNALVREYDAKAALAKRAKVGQGGAEECPEDTMMDAKTSSSSSTLSLSFGTLSHSPRGSPCGSSRGSPRVSPGGSPRGSPSKPELQHADPKGAWSGERNMKAAANSSQPTKPSLPPLGSSAAMADGDDAANSDRRKRVGNVLDNPKLLTQRHGVPLDRGSPPEGGNAGDLHSGARQSTPAQGPCGEHSMEPRRGDFVEQKDSLQRMEVQSFSNLDSLVGPKPPPDQQRRSPTFSSAGRSVKVTPS